MLHMIYLGEQKKFIPNLRYSCIPKVINFH